MVIVLMGVAGAGKTTVGRRLSVALNWQFYDADAFHSNENIAKMEQGLALTDEDRLPWLQRLQASLAEWVSKNENVVLASSLVKQSHRRTVIAPAEASVRLVYLKASQSLLARRLVERTGHFAGAALLESQMAALDEPSSHAALILDASDSPEELVHQIRAALQI
ncbi:MAG TPA: gluconokinase, GntK/IdnK-type [Anaerolineales bacterium]